jgi:hypothetical protein
MNFCGNGTRAFQDTTLPARVVFGFGAIAKVADEPAGYLPIPGLAFGRELC